MDTVWLVDDLPRNLRKFEENHRGYFKIETFSKIDEVLDRIHEKDYPDALLCDVFFYDSVEEAERVEAEIENSRGLPRKSGSMIISTLPVSSS
jgi:hypothetical protein